MFDPDDEPDFPLGNAIVDRVEAVLIAAERESRPVEINPFRGQLFEAFVTAEGAGLLRDDEDGLGADALCRRLGERWGLTDAMRDSVDKQQQLPSAHRAKMRLLWSLARMWMEWQYAWDRWPEFHQE